MNKRKKLTWNDLANYYDKVNSGRKARTLPMDSVFNWAVAQTDVFETDAEGYIYFIDEETLRNEALQAGMETDSNLEQ